MDRLGLRDQVLNCASGRYKGRERRELVLQSAIFVGLRISLVLVNLPEPLVQLRGRSSLKWI